MKAAIFNPYLDTLGGGERYSMVAAQVLAGKGYKVDIFWKDENIKSKLENRFGIKLGGVNFVEDIKRGDGYDVCFWVSDGSIPLLRARNNILHFQVPFTNVDGKSMFNKMKFFRINHIVCNSVFTKKVIDKEYGVDSVVVYPPVDVSNIKPKRKEDLVLYVGRFSRLIQSKGQDVLIKTFVKMCKKGLENWRFVLAGGVEVGAKEYVKKLKKLSSGYPITILESPDYKELKELYGKAKLFWSASGYGIDENKEPMKVEHFGIVTVEAMAAGCAVLVYPVGGQKEIVKNGKNGFVWKNMNELIKLTKELQSDPSLFRKITTRSKEDCQKYSTERFNNEFEKLLGN